MQQRPISSLNVSAVGLGCMNLSMGYGPADDTESQRLLHAALDAGVNFFDTAMVYGSGHNESLLNAVLQERRDDVVLATKCGLSRDGIDGDPVKILASCDASLQRLGTDVIDLYYLHRVDPQVPIEESVGALASLVQAGKVREIGLSEVCCDNLRRACKEHPIAALQSEYSLWSRTPERGILDACTELNVSFVPFSPLARGFLTGQASDVTQLADTDLRATIARPRFEPEAFKKNSQLLVAYAEIAETCGCTMGQLALAWLLAQRDGTMIPIPGTRSITHMLENAGAAGVTLEADAIEQLNQLINENTVTGTRYTSERMAEADAERD